MAFDDWKIIMQWVYSVAAREVFKSFGTWRQVPIFSYFNQIRCFQSIFCRSTISYQQIHRPVGRCFSLLDLRQVFHLNEDEGVDNYIDDVDLSFVQVFLWILGRPWFSVSPWCLVLNLQNYDHKHHDRPFQLTLSPQNVPNSGMFWFSWPLTRLLSCLPTSTWSSTDHGLFQI